jgi:nifR3 family TIM-barrel protein
MIQEDSAISKPNRSDSSTVARGFSVGGILVNPPLLLAPMEDVTNLPFRLIAKRIGNPGLLFTEFVSAMAIHYNPTQTTRKMTVVDGERPIGIQIFGGDPEIMAETARVAEEMGADLIDINMGCWVPKVVKTGAGAALLKDPIHAERIVSSVVKAVRVPVTVKVRAGWDYSLFAAPELAKRFQGAGAQMLTLHARFAKQGFEGEADWKLISELREAISIPLIGNGDVKTPSDAERMLRETGCDGVMVGRAAISNPWALAGISAWMKGIPAPTLPTLQDRIETALEHLRLMIDFVGQGSVSQDSEIRAVRQLRGQIPMYIKGEPGAAAIRNRLTACCSYKEIEEILGEFHEAALRVHLQVSLPPAESPREA